MVEQDATRLTYGGVTGGVTGVAVLLVVRAARSLLRACSANFVIKPSCALGSITA